MIARLRDLLRPSTPSKTPDGKAFVPFGLTSSEWVRAQELLRLDGWDTYLKALDESAKLHAETLFRTSNVEQIHFLRGRIAGLREAGMLIQRAKAHEEHQKNESERSERARPERSRASLYGTPGWRAQRNDQST